MSGQERGGQVCTPSKSYQATCPQHGDTDKYFITTTHWLWEYASKGLILIWKLPLLIGKPPDNPPPFHVVLIVLKRCNLEIKIPKHLKILLLK